MMIENSPKGLNLVHKLLEKEIKEGGWAVFLTITRVSKLLNITEKMFYVKNILFVRSGLFSYLSGKVEQI